MSLDFGKALSFITKEPNYIVKVLIGGALVFLSIIVSFVISFVGGAGTFLAMGSTGSATTGAALISLLASIIGTVIAALITIPALGYSIEVTRNVINGQPVVTPEWSNFGQLSVDGAKAWVCSVVLLLPAYAITFAARLPGVFAPENGSATLVGACGACLALPLFLIAGVALPIVNARYAVTRDIRQALNISEVFATLRSNIGTYMLLAIGVIGLSIAAVILGLITCGIGLPFLLFFLYLVSAHLSGQAYRIAQGQQADYGQQYGQQPYQQRPF